MSPTYRHKYKYFHSTVERAEDRQQKFHFCRLPFDVRPRNVKLNLSIFPKGTWHSRTILRTTLTRANKLVHACFARENIETASSALRCSLNQKGSEDTTFQY